jgi:tRNA-specific 2-thiouridylase
MYHTLGQRQGLAIGGLRDYSDEPWYVAGKDLESNVLIAVQGNTHPLLWSDTMQTDVVQWLLPPPGNSFRCQVKTRYRQEDVLCDVQLSAAGTAQVDFQQPVWAVTPGQYAVFYSDDACLGGGVINAAAAGDIRPDLSVQARSA